MVRRALFAMLSLVTACSGGVVEIGRDNNPPTQDASVDGAAGDDADGGAANCPDVAACGAWPLPQEEPWKPCPLSPPGSTGWTLVNHLSQDGSKIGGSGPTDIWLTWPLNGKIFHWNGVAFTAVSFPFTAWSVSAISPNDAWFAVDSGTNDGLVHWDGSSFTFVSPGPNLVSPWMAAANDVWAVNAAGLWHYDGTSWTMAVGGNFAAPIWGTASNDVWAVTAAPSAGTVVHWNGSKWSPSPGSPVGTLYRFSGTAPDDVWVVGTGPSNNGQFGSPILAHWDGTQWTSYPVPWSPGAVMSIWAAARDDVWAISAAPGHCPEAAIMHFDGMSWSSVPPEPNWSMQYVWGTGPHDVWITGPLTLLHRTQ